MIHPGRYLFEVKKKHIKEGKEGAIQCPYALALQDAFKDKHITVYQGYGYFWDGTKFNLAKSVRKEINRYDRKVSTIKPGKHYITVLPK